VLDVSAGAVVIPAGAVVIPAGAVVIPAGPVVIPAKAGIHCRHFSASGFPLSRE